MVTLCAPGLAWAAATGLADAAHVAATIPTTASDVKIEVKRFIETS
jgi:hypothetical protein